MPLTTQNGRLKTNTNILSKTPYMQKILNSKYIEISIISNNTEVRKQMSP